jgi:hypothetical protein
MSEYDRIEWQCALCQFAAETVTPLLSHLEEEHQIPREEAQQAQGRYTHFLDSPKYSCNTRTYSLGERDILNLVVQAGRDPDDPMGYLEPLPPPRKRKKKEKADAV